MTKNKIYGSGTSAEPEFLNRGLRHGETSLTNKRKKNDTKMPRNPETHFTMRLPIEYADKLYELFPGENLSFCARKFIIDTINANDKEEQ